MADPLEGRAPYILDTSAILAYLAGESGSERLATHHRNSAIPFMALSELYYVIWQKKGKAAADGAVALVKAWKLPLLLPDERVILMAGRLKAMYRLGIADSYMAAFALDRAGTLVTKDPDFQALRTEIKILALEEQPPHSPRRRIPS